MALLLAAARGVLSLMNATRRGWLSAKVADGVTSSTKSSVSHRAVAPVTALVEPHQAGEVLGDDADRGELDGVGGGHADQA